MMTSSKIENWSDFQFSFFVFIFGLTFQVLISRAIEKLF